jgi:RNA polymerase sigma-70 factor (ECF subfamily)
MQGVGMKNNTQIQDGLGSVSDAQRNSTKLSVSDTLRDFEQSVVSNRQKLYGMIFNMVYNHQDTEDLLQETYYKAYRALDGYNGRASMNTWLHTIAYNTTINHIRSKRNKFNISLDDADNNYVDQDPAYIEATTGIGTDKEVIALELKQELYRVIDSLPLQQQVVVKWFDICGYSHRDIANRLGVNENTVRSRLFYAHKKLQGMLANYKEIL